MEQKNEPQALTNSFIKSELTKVGDVQRELKTAEQIKFAKNLVNPDLTDSELFLFLAYANNLQLNPFTKEIISVVYYKSDPSKRRVNTVVTKDGKLVIARRTSSDTTIKVEAVYTKTDETGATQRVEDWEGGTLWGAVATVVREGKEYRVTVPLAEYDTRESIWATKKSTMIKKVALSQALTMAFPEILGGVYDDSELPTENGKSPTIAGGDEPATDKQVETLQQMGKEIPEGLTKQGAIELMTKKEDKNGSK